MTIARCCAVLLVSLGSYAAASPPLSFLTHRDGKLYDGAEEFRFVSWNIPNLHNVEDSFEFLGDSPWRWPNAFEIADALESVRQLNGKVARTYVISVRRPDGDMGDNVHVLSPGEFNEEAFRTLDLVVKIAAEKGVRLIIPLIDNWRWWGGTAQYEAFRNKPKGAFWTDPQLLEDFKQTVAFVVNRRNTLTGVRYRDDPAIFGWETGNELDSPAEWTAKIAAYLKQLDPNHLVIDGRSLHGVPTWSLDDPNVDVVTTHHYPNVGNNTAESVLEAIRTVGGKKAYFVGEFGFLPIEEAERMFHAVIDHGASGALYWSLRFHRREGGFYWHHEPSGNDLFKAYHWPGFAAGDHYRERQVIRAMRSASARINGVDRLPLPTPAPPRLLPPRDPGVLSWQGSAGASSYSVERATSADGPWETIATGVSDAAVQYRPLFVDEALRPSETVYYRVTAQNESGSSAASNTVGPCIANAMRLADEFVDNSRYDSVEGTTRLRTDQARKVQEDNHRLELGPRAAVSYTVAGPIQTVQLWAFAESGDQPITISLVDDEGTRQTLTFERRTRTSAGNDYGYLTPIRLSAPAGDIAARTLRISTPENAGSVQLSRLELTYGVVESR